MRSAASKIITLAAVCALAFICCSPDRSKWPEVIELNADVVEDASGRISVEGCTNLPDGTVLFVTVQGGASMGATAAEGSAAVVQDGAFVMPSTLDLPLDYEAKVSLAPGPNEQWADRFNEGLCTNAPASHIACVKGPEGAFRLEVTADGRLGEADLAYALAEQHLADLQKKLDAIDYEAGEMEHEFAQAGERQALAILAQRLRIRSSKKRSLGLAGPERDLLFPDVDQALVDAWEALEQLSAYYAARAGNAASEFERLEGVPDRFKRRRDKVQELIDSKRELLKNLEAPTQTQ